MPIREVPLSAEFFQDPWPLYEELRSDGPLHQVKLPNGQQMWLVIGHELARQLLSHPGLSKDRAKGWQLAQSHGTSGAGADASMRIAKNMLNSDPPDHTRLRALVGKAFTSHASAYLRPRMEQIAHQLLADIQPGSTIDLLEDYAFPLPIRVITELLGIPYTDRDRFRSWSQTIIDHPPFSDAEEVRAARNEFADYLANLIAAKRAGPRGKDLLDQLIDARVVDDRLSDTELISTVALLIIAGHETTVHLIANTVFLIALDSKLRARALHDRTALRAILEETLRFEGPAHTTTLRHTVTEIALNEATIPKEEFVLVSLAAANRDPEKFVNPNKFDPTRNVGGHLGFGHGIHYCVGAGLARLEAEVAIERLLAKFPNVTIAADPSSLRWRSGLLRGRTALPVVLDIDD
ncbi:cytochrome P450 family protein [Mycobacteroides abscessus]|uniref:cytochrome P450 family protein n=1 Tax=Mycobacteroides abscessus TaxID=36809 RepID=UPI00210801D5|nr:cytochrome P450 [Mycobacteroides abscessus]